MPIVIDNQAIAFFSYLRPSERVVANMQVLDALVLIFHNYYARC
nr:MAG TPA: hypothetical protein [Caudoviricetes sp.]